MAPAAAAAPLMLQLLNEDRPLDAVLDVSVALSSRVIELAPTPNRRNVDVDRTPANDATFFIITSSVVDQFKEIPLLDSLLNFQTDARNICHIPSMCYHFTLQNGKQ